MNSNDFLTKLRDNALVLITEGKRRYNEGKDHDQKDEGCRLLVKGIETLISYGKQETNEEIKKIIKEKIIEYTNEVQSMKAYLKSISNNNNQNNSNQNNSNQNNYNQSNNNQSNQSNQSNNNNAKSHPPQDNGNNEEANKMKAGLQEAIVTEKPNVKWSDVSGLENAKKALQEAVILPIKFPQIFTGSRKPWKGILLYGPPGTGKTFLAKACATECEGTFFSISSSDLISKWVGESEKLIKTLFKMAREQKPSIIFIDEIDSLTGNRSDGENEASRRVKTEFLVQMQGVGKDDEGILVLGATNIPWGLDPAIRRRFEKRIYISLPCVQARLGMLKNMIEGTPNNLSQEDFEYIAGATEGYTGSDISILVRDASFQPLRKCENARKFRKVFVNGEIKYEPCPPSDPQGIEMKFMDLKGAELKLPDVDLDDFNVAITKCKPSVGKQDLVKQEEFTQNFGQEG